jgi:hypothetical protein
MHFFVHSTGYGHSCGGKKFCRHNNNVVYLLEVLLFATTALLSILTKSDEFTLNKKNE